MSLMQNVKTMLVVEFAAGSAPRLHTHGAVIRPLSVSTWEVEGTVDFRAFIRYFLLVLLLLLFLDTVYMVKF